MMESEQVMDEQVMDEQVEISSEEMARAMYEFPNNSQRIEMNEWRFEIIDGVNELVADMNWAQTIQLFDGCIGEDMDGLISQCKVLKEMLDELIRKSEVE
jgi:hypothetical protein